MEHAIIQTANEGLSSLVVRAARQLAEATGAAEILDARDAASVAYDMAKKAARLAKAKGAHDTLVAAAHRAQADALLIESQAKRRLADEYDAAQERREIRPPNKETFPGSETLPNYRDAGLTAKAVHEARQFRNAEERDPGIVERTVEAALSGGQEPTRAMVKKAISPQQKAMTEKAREDEKARQDKTHLRDLRRIWRACSADVKRQFRDYIAE